ncbi:hypothetical protein TL16_g05640 [Triparma laevis f. inornata]|uniref:Anaphase-promoting complex subunit 1 n=1 Tax=Triparma laevis f. inornata TaxID=1714386 RepID=A0A9W7E7N3_9STRA|nr:hypothetical protein TL16_g05640 [Triparma laevis f. inornata]
MLTLTNLHACSLPPASCLCVTKSSSDTFVRHATALARDDQQTPSLSSFDSSDPHKSEDSPQTNLKPSLKAGLDMTMTNSDGPSMSPDSHLNVTYTTDEVLQLVTDPITANTTSRSKTRVIWRTFAQIPMHPDMTWDMQPSKSKTIPLPPLTSPNIRTYEITPPSPGCSKPHKITATWANFYDTKPPNKTSETREASTTLTGLTYSVTSRSLCVLSSPSLLQVHTSNGGIIDVPLPFESDAIFPSYSHGLFIQRCPTEDDEAVVASGDRDFVEAPDLPQMSLDEDGEEQDVNFKLPPKTNRLTSPPPAIPLPPLDTTLPSQDRSNLPPNSPLPSLFTLRHPLDELKPVAAFTLTDDDIEPSIDDSNPPQDTTHLLPPPPPLTDMPFPLNVDSNPIANAALTDLTQTQTLRQHNHNHPNTKITNLSSSSAPPSVAILAATLSSANHLPNPPLTSTLQSHNEALASALGVGQNQPDILNTTIISTHSNNHMEDTHNNPHPDQPSMTQSNQLNSDFVQTAQFLNPENTELHPHSALTCVWAEPPSSSLSPSTTVFPSTDLDGFPLLSLLSDGKLKVLELTVDEQTSAVCGATITGQIPCIAAQPVTASTTPGGIDTLLLNPDNKLFLHSGMTPLVECNFNLPTPTPTVITGLKFSVEDRVHLFYKTADEPTNIKSIRVKVSLSLSSMSPLGETVLHALGSTLPPSLAVTIRADCVSAAQALVDPLSTIEDSKTITDPAWFGVCTVLKSMLGPPTLPKNNQTPTDLQSLISSDFAKKYFKSNPTLADSFSSVIQSCASNAKGHPESTTYPTIEAAILKKIHLLSVPAAKEQISTIFDTLHLVYEDSKLSLNRWGWLAPLSELLQFFAVSCKGKDAEDFVKHYRLDKPYDEQSSPPPTASSTPLPRSSLTTFQTPPSIMGWLFSCVTEPSAASRVFPAIPPCDTSRRICRLYCIIFDSQNSDLLSGFSEDIHEMQVDGDNNNSSNTQSPVYSPSERVVLALLDERMSLDDLHNVPPGVVVPILEAIHETRQNPPSDWPAAAYHLIGREDMSKMQAVADKMVEKPKPCSPDARYAASMTSPSMDQNKEEEIGVDPEDKDGLFLVEKFSSMLFTSTDRVKEAARLLRSSVPIFLKVERPPEVTDHEYEQRKQAKLLLLCSRSMAAPIGRGMLTLGTCSPLLAEALPIPQICLAGRVPPTNATMQLDTSSCPPQMTAWPDFHNGVAAGLRLGMEKGVSRTWIVYNKPNPTEAAEQPPVNNSHGGLLFALGLRKHLGALAMTDIYEYLTQGNDTTTVGVLLGMAASKRATCDPSVSKMLCLHIPSLLPPPFTEMDVSSVAQIAAVAGVGILYQGSAHRLMTEFLLGEIGRKPSSDKIADREAYVLAAGFALGMVNLGKGKSGASAGLQDLKIEERLTQYLVGGRDQANGGGFNSRLGEESQRCSRIFEGESINVDVTSPGATMALGLLHIKSGNKSVANRLSLPSTLSELDTVRPDFLLLRVVSRALIMWEVDVEPTLDWVQKQIPPVILNAWEKLGDTSNYFRAAFGIANIDINRQNGGAGESPPKGGGVDSSAKPPSVFDQQSVKQAYVHIVAGACFALGLRFAGTGDSRAKEVIIKELLMLKKLREDNDRLTVARRPSRAIVDLCVGTAAVSLGLVMAGTGDMDAMKIFSELRVKCEAGVTYGTHGCIASAIGLLFLGGGSCTLGRSNEDIAALLVAFYPRWPIATTDNQFYLQALRHLYALAVKESSVECIDVDSGCPVFVPVVYKDKGGGNGNGEEVKAMSPLLLNTDVDELRIDSDRYYSIFVPSNSLRTRSRITLFVKRKIGHLTYKQDPHGKQALQVGNLQTFTEDAELLQFSKLMCDDSVALQRFEKALPGLGTFGEFCKEKLLSIVEKPEALHLLLGLRYFVESLMVTKNPLQVQNLRVCVALSEAAEAKGLEGGGAAGGGEKLLEGIFVQLIRENVEIFFESGFGTEEGFHEWKLADDY